MQWVVIMMVLLSLPGACGAGEGGGECELCPSPSYLDTLPQQSLSGAALVCWTLFANISPYVMAFNHLESNLTFMALSYQHMLNSSASQNAYEYQRGLYMTRQSISGGWNAYVIARQQLETLSTSVDCLSSTGCVEYTTLLKGIVTERSTQIPIDTIVETSEGALCIALYSLVLIYAGVIVMFARHQLFKVSLKYYRFIWIGVVLAAAFKLIWWCFLLVGMGVQTGIPPVAGRVVFRIGMLLQFFTVLLFLFLWIRAYFAVYFESHKVSMICYIVLGGVAVGGTAAAIAMGILAEQGGFDCSVVLLYMLEWLCIAGCIVLTSMTMQKLVEPEHKEKVRGLRVLLLVESILLVGLTLGLLLSFYVLFQPSLYAGGGWLQFFAMVAVPDLIVFGAFLTLILHNCRNFQQREAHVSARVKSTKSTSVMGTFSNADEDMAIQDEEKIPQAYRV